MNLTKEVQDLCSENSEHWWKKLKTMQSNWKVYPTHGLEKLISLKLP